MEVHRFNIRVYGLLLHKGRVLVSDERINNKRITKFPGGGMEPGEGTLECLQREIQEEMGMLAKDLRHYYTTDFFQASAFRKGDQVVSIYYTFTIDDPDSIQDGAAATGPSAEAGQHCRWLPLADARVDDVDLAIDRVVLRMLIDNGH